MNTAELNVSKDSTYTTMLIMHLIEIHTWQWMWTNFTTQQDSTA